MLLFEKEYSLNTLLRIRRRRKAVVSVPSRFFFPLVAYAELILRPLTHSRHNPAPLLLLYVKQTSYVLTVTALRVFG